MILTNLDKLSTTGHDPGRGPPRLVLPWDHVERKVVMTLVASPHPARCAVLLRRQGTEDLRTADQIADAIHRHCGHSRLRSHRLARGWTLDGLIAQIKQLTDEGDKLKPSRVSRWELDQDNPSPGYREALCRVYCCDPVTLGLRTDFRETPATEGSQPGGAHFTSAGPVGRGARTAPSVPKEEDMRRREVLLGMLTSAGGVLTAPALAAASAVRRRMDETLSGSVVSDGTVAYWEEVAEQYGRTYKTRAAVPFLVDIVADFAEVQTLTDRRLPSGARRDLCAVAAKFAGLISMTMTNLGDYREARGWGHTARLAADESGDPVLRAWVATRAEAIPHLYFGDPHGALVAARQAQLLARNAVCGPAVMAPALEARAAAVLGDAETAREALRRAETVFSRLSRREDIAYSFTEAQLYFYRSNTYTTIGDYTSAERAQDAALSTFAAEERLDPTLVHLDRAACLLKNGDVTAGAEYASDVLLGLSEEFRPSIVLRKARALTEAIPPSRRSNPAVRKFHDVLALGS
jgi:transcriptional regulator with XRE-family HTH domain